MKWTTQYDDNKFRTINTNNASWWEFILEWTLMAAEGKSDKKQTRKKVQSKSKR